MKIAHISDIHWRGISRHQEFTRGFKILFKELNELKPDLIVQNGDFVHSKTNLISPEMIDRVSWSLTELAKIAPTIHILGNHDCFTEAHEVLTKNGWKKFSNLLESDVVATYNQHQQTIEFQKPKNYIKKYTNENLLEIKGKEIDAIVTKTHEFIYSYSGNKKYKNKFFKTTASNIPKNASIPINGIIKNYRENIFSCLLGFTFAEATFVLRNSKTKACRIQFKLKCDREINYLKNILEKLNYTTNFRKQKDGSTVICIYKELAKKIYNFFDGKKEIPNNIFNNDFSFLKSFLEGYLKGDGSNKKNNFWTFYSISKNSRDILVTISRLIGGTSHINNQIVFGNYKNSKQQYGGSCNIKNETYFTKISSVREIPFEGFVYCVSVENGNLLIKHNEKIYVAGNCNLTNKDRLDTITPIHNALNLSNSYLYKKSGVYIHEVQNKKIGFCVYSVFDKDGWDSVEPSKEADINIALFHGAVKGCSTDLNWTFPHGEVEVDFFKKYDFVFLGDIHKQQFLDLREDINGIKKPWIGYPGSLFQNSFGEQIKKGYFVWDIRDKNDWDVEFKKLVNLAPFVTLNWNGSVEKTLKAFEELHGSYSYLPGTRYRILSNVLIPQIQTKQLVTFLKDEKRAEEVTFKTDIISNIESIETHGVKINKKSLSQDSDSIIKLYKKYVAYHKDMFDLTNEELEKASNIIKDYFTKLHLKNNDLNEARNVQWSIKEFKFNNIFIYGENNYINFEKLNNIVGIFGNNRAGKSSVIAALMYTLFNGSDRGSLKNSLIVNKNKKECFGSIRINVGGTDYLIERRTVKTSKNDDSKSTTTVNLFMIENRNGVEIKVSKNDIAKNDTDKVIRSLIGTPEDFLLTALASQHDLHRFIDNKATKRKEILNRFLELDIFDTLFDYAKSDYVTLDSQSKNYSTKDWIRLIERTEKEIDKLEKDISSYDEKIVVLNDKKDSLNLWIKTHENKVNSFEIDAIEKLNKLILSLNSNLSNTEEELLSHKKLLKDKQNSISFHKKLISKIDINLLEEEEKRYSELKQVLNDLQKSYDVHSIELNNQQKAVTKLKVVPCGTQFPDCHYIKDAHEAKKTISDQEKLVKDLLKSIKENQKLIEKYVSKNINQKIKEFHNSETSLLVNESEAKNLESKIEHKIASIENIKKEISLHEKELKNLTSSIKLIESEEFKKKKEQLNSIIDELNSLQKKKNDCLLSLGAKKDYLKNLYNEQSQGKDIIRKLKLYDSVQTAFSKNGIPVMVLKEQLPAINLEMSKILDSLVDFKITLETDMTANIMDVYFEDSVNKRPIELCSGMEKTICSLALRVALGNISALPRPDIFILDESFGALDENNMQKSMDLLGLFRDYFKTVLIISHINEIKEIADSIIEIKNDGIESRIIA